MWIKFSEDYAGQKAGAVVEVDDTIARAYVAAGKAAEHQKETEAALSQVATAETRAALDSAYADFTSSLRSISDGLKAASEEWRSGGKGKRPNPQVSATESEDDKFLAQNGEFRNLGHFAHDVVNGNRQGNPDADSLERLRKWNGTLERVAKHKRAMGTPDGMFETSDPDGGVLVPPDFSGRIWERVYNQENLLSRTDTYNVAGNTLVLPANTETSRVDGSRWGGTLGYWEGEAQQFTGSRPKFRDLQFRLKKVTVLSYVTNELLADAGIALDQYLMRSASGEITFQILKGLIRGTGAGLPVGLLNDPALISVPKETNQQAKTVLYENVLKMYNRLWGPCRASAIWLINQEIEPQLDLMALPVGTSGVPVYQKAGEGGSIFGGGSAPRFGQLKGLPVIPIEQCSGLGLVGDILLVDLSQYVTIVKGGIQSSMSIHLKFDYDETVFKWLFRMDGMGAWSAPLTPYQTNVAQTYSFVTALAAR